VYTPSLFVNVTLPSSVKSTPAWYGVLCTPKLSVLHGTTGAHHIWCTASTFVLRVQDSTQLGGINELTGVIDTPWL